MDALNPAYHPAPGGGHDHREAGGAHVSMRDYVIGFWASVVLTAIPFALVMSGALSSAVAVPVCAGFAVVQIVVHLVYFLHMKGSSARSWNMAAFVFTLVILAILVAGSLWVMYHLNANMMPGMMPEG